MAGFTQRGEKKIWWITIRLPGGKRLQFSSRTSNRREAEAIARRYEVKRDDGLLGAPSKTEVEPFLASLCAHWKAKLRPETVRAYLGCLRYVFGERCDALKRRNSARSDLTHKLATIPIRQKFINVHYLEQITPTDVASFLRHMHDNLGANAKWVNNVRGVLGSMFSFAAEEHGYVFRHDRYKNPSQGLNKYKWKLPPIVFLSDAQIEEQFTALADYPVLFSIVAVYIYGGLRCSEALWLTVEDIDMNPEEPKIMVREKNIDGIEWKPKTKDREVPIGPKLFNILKGYFKDHNNKWVFPSPQGDRWKGRQFYDNLKKVNGVHGLDWTPADFRHTFATMAVVKGHNDLRSVSTVMGNSIPVCDKHYVGEVREAARKVVALM